jgi:hypothetical protein
MRRRRIEKQGGPIEHTKGDYSQRSGATALRVGLALFGEEKAVAISWVSGKVLVYAYC